MSASKQRSSGDGISEWDDLRNRRQEEEKGVCDPVHGGMDAHSSFLFDISVTEAEKFHRRNHPESKEHPWLDPENGQEPDKSDCCEKKIRRRIERGSQLTCLYHGLAYSLKNEDTLSIAEIINVSEEWACANICKGTANKENSIVKFKKRLKICR